MAEQTPYEKYAHFCRTVAGIEPKSEEDWERDSNKAFVRLPCGTSLKQMAGCNIEGNTLGRRAKQRKAEATSGQNR
jgi:hypothetical protein